MAQAPLSRLPASRQDPPPALSGERIRVPSPAGELNVYVAGEGAPLLLVHSINAAASAAEVRPLHDYYRRTRRVFSVDLPGYGFSERKDLPYTPRSMTDGVIATMAMIRDTCGGQPIDALAVSLSCEYLARAAAEHPGALRSIALVSPTGFKSGASRRRPPGSNLGIPGLYRLLRGPGWGRWVFTQLTRPAVIRYFLQRTWGGKVIDEELWRYDVLTAKPAAAEFAPLRFLSGYLFSGDIHTIYEALDLPVWMSHGVRGDFTDYRGQRIVEGRANWRFSTFPTGALPYFEVFDAFCAEYDGFLDDVAKHGGRSDPKAPSLAGRVIPV